MPVEAFVHRSLCVVYLMIICSLTCRCAEEMAFVSRHGDTLMLQDHPYGFAGANAYYLMESAARGDSATVGALFAAAAAQGIQVVRTWAFHEGLNSSDPAVLQSAPGHFEEQAFRALDFVIAQAHLHGIRLVLPLVNNWEDFGGMNAYVRWRSVVAAGRVRLAASDRPGGQLVRGQFGRQYHTMVAGTLGHDDFYTDTLIRQWYQTTIKTVLGRINTRTGIRYSEEPAILAWELANEPRSSDRTGDIVKKWASEMSAFAKSLDFHHLVGVGDEGMDVSADGYAMDGYDGQDWLFRGETGESFSALTSIPSIDFGSAHLYPDAWGLSPEAGNVWIRDHIRLSRTLRKPCILGEFASMTTRGLVYDSWCTTAVQEYGAGAIVWQLVSGNISASDAFAFSCPDRDGACASMARAAVAWAQRYAPKAATAPDAVMLMQNYPNPFNGVTVIQYTLPADATISLDLWNAAGAHVRSIASGFRAAGLWREILNATHLASGVYFSRLCVVTQGPSPQHADASRIMVLVK